MKKKRPKIWDDITANLTLNFFKISIEFVFILFFPFIRSSYIHTSKNGVFLSLCSCLACGSNSFNDKTSV